MSVSIVVYTIERMRDIERRYTTQTKAELPSLTRLYLRILMKKETKLKNRLEELTQKIADGGKIDSETVGKLFETVFALKAERDKPPPVISSGQISRSSTTASRTVEEEKPVIYLRVYGKSDEYDWFLLKNNDNISSKPPICKCGAVANLESPVFCQPNKLRLQSSVAAVGSNIYVFGGYFMDNGKASDCAEVSYIDTQCPSEGWKVCRNPMPKARSLPYPITLDDNRVLLVGGFRIPHGDRPFAQMYDPLIDHWDALENYPDQPPPSTVFGHAVVEEKGEKIILIHDLSSFKLYTYNLNKDLWGIRWGDEFGKSYNSGALVDGIYYVVDVVTYENPARVALFGYDVSLKHAKCVPVDFHLKKKKNGGKQWVPMSENSDLLPLARLFSLGDSKLAMVWHDQCFHDRNVRQQYVCWSTFKMTREKGADSGLKLVARPLSHVCYHVDNDGNRFNSFVPVFPSKRGLKEDISVQSAFANLTTN